MPLCASHHRRLNVRTICTHQSDLVLGSCREIIVRVESKTRDNLFWKCIGRLAHQMLVSLPRSHDTQTCRLESLELRDRLHSIRRVAMRIIKWRGRRLHPGPIPIQAIGRINSGLILYEKLARIRLTLFYLAIGRKFYNYVKRGEFCSKCKPATV